VPKELPARPDVEHYRKQAKALVRAFRDGAAVVVGRAVAVLGRRARERFQLSDAQYVIAVEHGHASWAEFRRACEAKSLDALAGVERGEIVLPSELRYTEGLPVEVFVRKRMHRYAIDDGGAAVRLADKPQGWLDVAEEVVEEPSLNVNRRGVVFVGTVYPRMLEGLVSRVAEASLAVYEALLELES
jgi:hypothetical protein